MAFYSNQSDTIFHQVMSPEVCLHKEPILLFVGCNEIGRQTTSLSTRHLEGQLGRTDYKSDYKAVWKAAWKADRKAFLKEFTIMTIISQHFWPVYEQHRET